MPVGLAVVFAAVILCLTMLTSTGKVAAQDSPQKDTEVTLEPVVVSAARLADELQDVRRIPGQVYVVTSEELARDKPDTVQDALRKVPGIVFYDSTGNPFQRTIDLRGFNAQPNPGVSVFVDGVRVNEPDSNAVNWDLIPIQNVERIEVLPGPSAVYGQNATSGVINIITKRGTKTPQATVTAGFGSYSHYQVNATTSGPLPSGLDYYINLGLDRGSAYRDYSDSRVSTATGRLGFHPSDATDLNLSYTYVNNRLEQPGALTLSELDQNRRQNITQGLSTNEFNTIIFTGRQKLAWGFSLAGNVSYRQSSLDQDNAGRFSVARLATDTNTTSGVLQLSHEDRFWGRQNRFSVGGEFQYGRVEPTGSGSFGGFPFSSEQSVVQNVFGVFAQDSFDLTSELNLTAAVRYDSANIRFTDEIDQANSGSSWYGQVTPRVGLTYTPWSALTLYGNYGQGFQIPTTNELFSLGPFGSNPDLKPVKSETFELGLRTRPASWLEGRLALFLTNVTDQIFFVVTDPATFAGRNENLPKTRVTGAEVGVKIYPTDWMDILLNYSYTKSVFQTDFSLFSGDVQKGDRVPLVPLTRVNATVNFRPLQGLEIGVTGLYVSRQVLLNDEANQSYYRLQDAFTVNMQASYTWKWLRFFVQGNNLTNQHYETYGIVSGSTIFVMPAPGINVFGGVTVRFENYY
jgi:iron complex outermembrane receptor protein